MKRSKLVRKSRLFNNFLFLLFAFMAFLFTCYKLYMYFNPSYIKDKMSKNNNNEMVQADVLPLSYSWHEGKKYYIVVYTKEDTGFLVSGSKEYIEKINKAKKPIKIFGQYAYYDEDMFNVLNDTYKENTNINFINGIITEYDWKFYLFNFGLTPVLTVVFIIMAYLNNKKCYEIEEILKQRVDINEGESIVQAGRFVSIVKNYLVVANRNPSLTDLDKIKNTQLIIHSFKGAVINYSINVKDFNDKKSNIILPKVKRELIDDLMYYLYKIGKNYKEE